MREAINRLEKASKDKSIAGVVLNIQNPSIGRGKVEELRAAIARFRKAGKKVYAQLETAMPADYLVACACDEIVMPETGMLMLPGIHAEATFYKGLLGQSWAFRPTSSTWATTKARPSRSRAKSSASRSART